MRVQAMSGLVVIGLAGLANGGEPAVLNASNGDVRHAGHIYFNIATGERLLTVIGDGDSQRGVDGELGDEIWVVSGPATGCPGGGTIGLFFALDYTEDTSGHETFSPMLLDWGDIEPDTVVDCVQIHWITDHADTDIDSDSFPDGVEGFGATWIFWDGMNGRSAQVECTAEPLVGFTFYNLPGEYPVDPATLAFYTADIDLGGSFGTSLTFEITDTDGDLQGASVASSIAFPVVQDDDSDSVPDWDPDQDGLADWGWSIDFIQPGTVDFDNADGDSDSQTGVDGDLSAFATAGLAFGLSQPGHAKFDPLTETWSWIPGPDAGINENLFGLVSFGTTYSGPLWFGEFSCDPFMPLADFAIVLYGPGAGTGWGECGDISGPVEGVPDAVVDFFDISYFLLLYSTGDMRVDFSGPTTGTPDGVLDFFDVTLYLGIVAAGCP